MPDYLSGLNTSQKKAVMHTRGPLLVLAGPGSGKTRVLTVRIARLVKERVCPASEILAVTFTNKAAREMKERLAKLLSRRSADAMTVSTFHSLGARILREHGHHLGVQRHFTILSDHERLATIKGCLRFTGRAKGDDDHEKLAAEISMAKNGGIGEADDDAMAPKTRKVLKAYGAAMLKRQAVDFDDLLLLPLRLFEQHPEVLAEYQRRYRFVAIDEFQDTNTVQMRLARLLAAPRNNLMVVGDDDQGIYSWRGAVLDNILSFNRDFKGCMTVVLDKNYRSTRQILDAAFAVVAHNRGRGDKRVTSALGDGDPIMHYTGDDEDDEAEWIAQTLKRHAEEESFRYRDHALLFRTNALMRRFEEALRRHRLPYKTIGATSFFDRKEIRDVMAYLRFFANQDDELSLERMLKVPNKGIAPATMIALDNHASSRKIALWRALVHADAVEGVAGEQQAKLREFRDFCQSHLHRLASGKLAAGFRAVLEECGYLPHLRQAAGLDETERQRLENVEEVVHGLEIFEAKTKKQRPTLADYVQDLMLVMSDEDEEDESRKSGSNAVSLMTLHKAKGLEFPVVFLPGLDDAVFPSSRSVEEGRIDEERRLFFVGMTRAKKRLYLTYPSTKVFRTKQIKVKPSRFIWEIPEEFMDGRPGEKHREERSEFVKDFFAQMQEKFAGTNGNGQGNDAGVGYGEGNGRNSRHQAGEPPPKPGDGTAP